MRYRCIVQEKMERPQEFVLALLAFYLSCANAQNNAMINVGEKSMIRDPTAGIFVGNFIEKKTTKLNVTSLKNVHVKSKNLCHYECLKDSRCLSYNIAVSPNSVGRYKCQILDKELIMFSQFLVNSLGFDHYSIKTKCTPWPCMYFENCVPYYENNSYTCECRLPYYGAHCEQDCGVALGMESRSIANSKITANFYVNDANRPSHARLNLVLGEGGWTARASGHYLQVDLTVLKNIYAYATQGRAINGRYTKTLKLMYSQDMTNWLQYHPTYAYVFQANVDYLTAVKTILPKGPVVGRGVRFVAVTYYIEPALRVELYGCNYIP